MHRGIGAVEIGCDKSVAEQLDRRPNFEIGVRGGEVEELRQAVDEAIRQRTSELQDGMM